MSLLKQIHTKVSQRYLLAGVCAGEAEGLDDGAARKVYVDIQLRSMSKAVK